MIEEHLRDIIAGISGLSAGEIVAGIPLNGILGGSLGRARLDAAIREQIGVANPSVYHASTFGELCRSFDSPASPTLPTSNAKTVLSIESPTVDLYFDDHSAGAGIDIETIAGLPDTSDYWEEDFYKAMFTAQEIAYAVLQASPRASFAVMWCAKEALKKAEPQFASLQWGQIEVVHDGDNKPSLKIQGRPYAGSLSASHTGEIACAIVISSPHASSRVSESSLTREGQGGASRQDNIFKANGFIAVISLLVAIIALVVSLARH